MGDAASESGSNESAVLNPGPPNPSPLPDPGESLWESFWRSIPNRLWGYDFFISYHWESGGSYAVNLAQRLRDRNYDVFLDRYEYAVGDDWKREGRRALRHTQRLILIATLKAVTQSQPVAREVEIFTGRGKRVILIVFGERFTDADRKQFPTLRYISESLLDIVELPERRGIGPSDAVLDRLVRTHGLLRRRSLRAIVVGVALSILTVAFLVTAWQYTVAEERRIEADSRRLAALANSLGTTRPDLGAILSVQANRVYPTNEARASVLSTVLREPRLIRFLIGQAGHVEHLAFSPDGRLLGAGNDEGTLVLWDVDSGHAVGTYRHPSSGVWGLAISPDSSHVAAGFAGGSVLLWDWKLGARWELKPFGEAAVEELAFSADGAYLLAHYEGKVLRYHIPTQALAVHHLGAPDECVAHVVFHADGKTALAGGSAGIVFSQNLVTDARTEMAKLGEPVGAIALDESSGRWAVGTQSGRIAVYGASSGAAIELRKPDRREVRKIRLSEGGRVLAAELDGHGSRLVTWRVACGSAPVPLDHPTLLHDFAFNKTGAYLASCGLYSRLLIHDLLNGKRSGEPLAGHGQQVYCVAFSPRSASILASSGDDGNVILWDILRTSRLAESATPGVDLPSSVEGVAFSPADATIAGGGSDGMLFIRRAGQRGVIIKQAPDRNQMFRQFQFSKDGDLLVAGGETDGLVLFRRRADWEYEFVPTKNNVKGIIITPDAKAIRVFDMGSVFRTFRAADGKETASLGFVSEEDRGRETLLAAAFRKDGEEVALGYMNGDLLVASTADGKIRRLSKRRAMVTALTYSPDGKILASSAENSVLVTEPGTDRVLARLLDRHPSAVNALAFSSSGQTLAAGCVDGTILLFDVPTRQPLGALPAHSGTVFALAFHSTASLLLSGGADKRALMFNLDFEACRAEARRIAGRNLSLDEWNQYMGSSAPYERTFPELPVGDGLNAR